MKLAELKFANPGFFSPKMAEFYGDDCMVITREGDRHVLKVIARYGTRPVYNIAAETKQLSCLRHDCEDASSVATR
jgi:hypothetical protein